MEKALTPATTNVEKPSWLTDKPIDAIENDSRVKEFRRRLAVYKNTPEYEEKPKKNVLQQILGKFL